MEINPYAISVLTHLGWRKGEILILSLLPRSRGYNVAEVETVRLAVSCNLLCNLDHSIFTDTLYNE